MGLTRVWRRRISATAVLLLLSVGGLLYAVQSTSSSRRTTTGSVPQPSIAASPNPANSQVLFITGAVVQENGLAAPPRTRVECVCSARTKRTASVDSRGYFSLQISGQTRYSTLTPDVSDEPGSTADLPPNRASRRFGLPTWVDSMSSAGVAGCELRATLEGFRSNTVALGGANNVGQLDVGTIVLFPLAKVTGTLVSVTGLQAPKQARKLFEQGEKSLAKNNREKAESELKAAVRVYPQYAAAWFALGQIYELRQCLQDAQDAYQQAIVADGSYVKPYVALARLAGIEKSWREVADITDYALALDPLDFPEAYYLNSMAYYSLGMLDKAERSARRALRLDPLHRIPAALLILADILEQKQDFAGSLEQLRNFLQVLPNAPSADRVRAKIKELEQSLSKRG